MIAKLIRELSDEHSQELVKRADAKPTEVNGKTFTDSHPLEKLLLVKCESRPGGILSKYSGVQMRVTAQVHDIRFVDGIIYMGKDWKAVNYSIRIVGKAHGTAVIAEEIRGINMIQGFGSVVTYANCVSSYYKQSRSEMEKMEVLTEEQSVCHIFASAIVYTFSEARSQMLIGPFPCKPQLPDPAHPGLPPLLALVKGSCMEALTDGCCCVLGLCQPPCHRDRE
ncbi:hypothetical protein UY3_08463 [Chelonia mydas]|uniref:Uncharacterized protein n=1 Tax=Chelonia mydas TaxID=8469 RepID=M7BB53_CHEMY|nr:hypothetical protein UY3_08463 [Chelonia mydas]